MTIFYAFSLRFVHDDFFGLDDDFIITFFAFNSESHAFLVPLVIQSRRRMKDPYRHG